MVDQVGDLVPFEELRLLAVALPHADPDEAGGQQHVLPGLVLGQEAVLPVPVQLLGPDNVVDLEIFLFWFKLFLYWQVNQYDTYQVLKAEK